MSIRHLDNDKLRVVCDGGCSDYFDLVDADAARRAAQGFMERQGWRTMIMPDGQSGHWCRECSLSVRQFSPRFQVEAGRVRHKRKKGRPYTDEMRVKFAATIAARREMA